MKSYLTILTACGALGGALSSGAQTLGPVDVSINGTVYAITTVTPALTYNSANGNYYFSYPNTLTPALFSTLTTQPWFGATDGNSAYNFSAAYVAAVQAADANASTDGNLQAADNTVFINTAYGTTLATLSTTTVIAGYDDGLGGTHQNLYQTTPLNQPWTLAEATVVVPEPGAYGAAAAFLALGLGAVSRFRKAARN